MTDPIVEIPVEDIRKVLPFMARGDVRYYLNGIYVEPYNGGALVVCTNGHVMGVVESKAGRCDAPRIIKGANMDFVAALKGVVRTEEPDGWDLDEEEDEDEFGARGSAQDKLLVVESADGRAAIKDKLGIEHYVLPGKPFEDGKYPDWRKVLPPVESLQIGSPQALSAHYLTYFTRALCDVRPETQVVFYCDKSDPNKPCIVRFDAMHELVVVLMPMRRTNPVDSWPSWMLQAPTPVVTAVSA